MIGAITSGRRAGAAPVAEAAREDGEDRSGVAVRSSRAEVLGYEVLALLLAALLWRRVSAVDGFYLDEWGYVHGGAYMWSHFPGALVGTVPEWTRGLQRLYPLLIGAPWAVLGTSAAFTLTHALNVALLVSAVVPAALLARRIIVHPALRVLGVALAIGVPWLVIASHLLTENLAFPLFLWSCWAVLRAVDAPSWRSQLAAIVLIGALVLCRTNLAPVMTMLVVAVVAREVLDRRDHRGEPFGRWLRGALRREALVLAAVVVGLLVASKLLSGATTSSFGVYGSFRPHDVVDRLVGTHAEATRHAALTYGRALVQGSFVLPFVLGLGTGLAGAAGRLGRRLVLPCVVMLTGSAVLLVMTAAFTAEGALEERYAFYPAAPLALLAVAGVEHAARLRRWVAAAAAVAVWCLYAGFAGSGLNAGTFFAAPAGGFWARVLDWRLRRWEDRLFGWAFLPATGWLLVAVGLVALVVVLHGTARRAPLRTALLTGGLAVCLVGQLLVLDYDFARELYGTTEAPGGIALSADRSLDRPVWVDDLLPDGASAAIQPALSSAAAPAGGVETQQLWNKDLDATVSLQWDGAPVSVPPGYGTHVTAPGPDGLARWIGAPPRWLVSQPDDPRVQFLGGRPIGRSPDGVYALRGLSGRPAAVWTTTGMQGDGSLVAAVPAAMALDRAAVTGVRQVTLDVTAPAQLPEPTRWQLEQEGRIVRSGRLAGGASMRLRLPVTPCPAAGGACPAAHWRLIARGPGVALPFPAYGKPGPPRAVLLQVTSARLGG